MTVKIIRQIWRSRAKQVILTSFRLITSILIIIRGPREAPRSLPVEGAKTSLESDLLDSLLGSIG